MSHVDTIIRLLVASDNAFVSGEQLSRELGISRTAIWKYMKQLRQMGYELESVSHKGYRLLHAPDCLDTPEFMLALERSGAAAVHFFEEVDSTQTVARRLAEQGAPAGTLVIAERQTAGRGRFDRKWQSPYGRGIWLSLILRPDVTVQWSSQLTLLSSVALCMAIREQTGLPAGIKWPNDILIGERKLSGMLLESVAEAEQIRYVIVGIGINVNQLESDFSADIAHTATSLRIAADRPFQRAPLIAALLVHLQQLLHEYAVAGFTPIGERWRAMSVSLNRAVKITSSRGIVEGYAETIDEYGALVLRMADGTLRKQFSGDLELLPLA